MSNGSREGAIPVVDISAYGLDVTDLSKANPEEIHTLAETVCSAFKDIGFCYIENHGIPIKQINAIRNTSKQFFEQPVSYKETYARGSEVNHGWVSLGREKLNPDRPAGDYKEAYNFTPSDEISNWPDKVPEFETAMKSFFESCTALSLRIFDLMSWGLKLEEKDFLRKCHSYIGQKGNATSVRSLYYPSPPIGQKLISGQIQCGEHSDYGTLTLLLQDSVGGLQVKNLHGEYIDATPIDGTILINIGDLMQRWTADKLTATKHRVIIPEDILSTHSARQSIVFFVHPDDEVMIHCLDGSAKYEPVSSINYLKQRFGVTY